MLYLRWCKEVSRGEKVSLPFMQLEQYSCYNTFFTYIKENGRGKRLDKYLGKCLGGYYIFFFFFSFFLFGFSEDVFISFIPKLLENLLDLDRLIKEKSQ